MPQFNKRDYKHFAWKLRSEFQEHIDPEVYKQVVRVIQNIFNDDNADMDTVTFKRACGIKKGGNEIR